MCGIAGIVSLNDQKIEPDTLLRMRDVMIHRGPDDSGYYVNERGSVALAHRRLSIIDLSSLGHQPMLTEDGNICLIYNGELYNFRDIRQELQNDGHVFRSTSDTEVILRAYQQWGEDAFKRFNGMYAICIYDKKNDQIYLARGHAGIKPVYYSLSDSKFIFASETKAFLAFDADWAENPVWKIYFLTFGHIPEPFTTLKDVYMLPRGAYLKLDLHKKQHELREHAPITINETVTDLREAVGLVRNGFIKAVERHLISDAPIGVFLSGGIDSSLVALIANRFLKEKLRTLSVIFDEKEFSEEPYQDIVLRKINSTHHAYRVTKHDFLDNFDDIFKSMDQPTIDGVNTYFIAKCAKEDGLKAVLSGMGGDELFGGYSSFTRINHLWNVKGLNRNIRKLFSLSESSGIDKLRRFSFLSMQEPLSFYLLLRGLYTPRAVSDILGCSVSEVQNALNKLHVDMVPDIGKQNFVSHMETSLYMKNQLLKDTDFMSMRHSVEVRVPFLDRNFMETVFSIKEAVKFRDDIPKFLLIKAFEDILPEEIITRKKQGFTFPFDVWMRSQGKDFFADVVARGGVNRKHADKVWNEFQQGNMHWSKIWAMVVTGKIMGPGIKNCVTEKKQKNILVHRIGQLGDTLCAIPAMKSIRDAYPDANIALLYDLHSERNLPVAKDVIEDLQLFDDYIGYDPQKLFDITNLTSLHRKLRAAHYDILFYLMPEARGEIKKTRDWTFFKTAGIIKIIGMDNSTNSHLVHETDRLLKILQRDGIHTPEKTRFDLPINNTHIEKVNALWEKAHIPRSAQVIAIAAGSKMPVKRWPIERFEAAGHFLIKDHNAFLVVLGGVEDMETGNYLANKWGSANSVNWAGKTSYMESAEVLKRSSLYLGNDTGTMHLAAAVGTSCVAIFSARDFKYKWYPYGDNHIVLRHDISCQHCMLEKCEEKKMKCIMNVTEAEVRNACEILLKKMHKHRTYSK